MEFFLNCKFSVMIFLYNMTSGTPKDYELGANPGLPSELWVRNKQKMTLYIFRINLSYGIFLK